MEDKDKTPLTDFYSQPYQGKKYSENNTEAIIVPTVIKIMAWLTLVIGILCIFNSVDGAWKYGLCITASSIFLFGFSAIVKAAYKYLND